MAGYHQLLCQKILDVGKAWYFFCPFLIKFSMYVLAYDVYGFLGALFGTCSIMTMVVIGYDRYNVIVKGLTGKRISPGMATIILIVLWVYATVTTACPFWGWGGYTPEGLLITCGYDYLSQVSRDIDCFL